ncbi:MAG: alpha-glucosidase [Promethearchaeota archaeon]|jgi:oligo-1,6-glucosidase/alpha-glucosidase
MDDQKYKWWQKTVVYQVYPRSFKDSSGNGIGDIQGIIEKLGYIQDLGIETIWFSPFFKSPQTDYGYDVSNYREIDPEYGNMNDFNMLLEKIHKRDMKIVLDLVLNHTSVEHPWFKESASSRDNPKRDWYIWRDGKKPNGKKPPNNWKTIPGGKAWKYDETTDQWFYFHFLPFQPDLNYRNPEVKEEILDMVRYWLNKGVDGFRLDILQTLYEDIELRNNPFTWSLLLSDKKAASNFQHHIYDANLPETFEFILELRKIMDEYHPERFMVGEAFGSLQEISKYYGQQNNGVHMNFLFEFIPKALSFKSKKIRKIISKIEKTLPPPYTPTYTYGNHDRNRYMSLLKGNIQKAKILATLQLTLRGVPYIYYGEEIGMTNVNFKLKTSKDPIGQKFAKFPFNLISKIISFPLTRDVCRTPMQWNNSNNAGFCSGLEAKPWLRISDSYKKINISNLEKTSESLLNCYKRLIKVRKNTTALQIGKFEFIDIKAFRNKILAYRRIYEEEEVNIFLNYSNKRIQLKASNPNSKIIFSTLSNRLADGSKIKENLILSPLEGILLKKF